MKALQKIAGKTHQGCAIKAQKLISLDNYKAKHYNCNQDEFSNFHLSSFKGLDFNRRGFRPVADTLSAIISKSPKSLFVPKDSKRKSDSPAFKLYAKRFYSEIKQEQNQVLHSNLSTLNPNIKGLL